jgi:hypothetical protein
MLARSDDPLLDDVRRALDEARRRLASQGKRLPSVSPKADEYSRKEEIALRNDARKIANLRARTTLDTQTIIKDQILPLARNWTYGLFALVIVEGLFPDDTPVPLNLGFAVLQARFHLSDAVWVALLGGTTAALIGILTALVRAVYKPE